MVWAQPAGADSITIGGATNAGSCVPFGCTIVGSEAPAGSIYQQVYAAGLFGYTFDITRLDFFNTVQHSGGDQYVDPAHYEIRLSTTAAGVNGLDPVNFSSNAGGNATLVFSGFLGGNPAGEVPPGPGATLPFAWDTAFRYDPRQGNLLLEVRKTGGSFFGDDGAYLDFADHQGMSMVSDFGGFSPYWNNRSIGLVTRFSGRFGDPVGQPEPVPEPATLLLLGGGLAATLSRRRK